MSKIVTKLLTNLTSFIQDHQISFTSGLLILFTTAGEQIFEESAFNCPCEHSSAFNYALAFLLVPAFVLFLIGIATSNLNWRLFHGCWRRDENARNGFTNTSIHCCMVIARSSIVPLAWLFVAFLDGDCYACMQADEPCNKNGTALIQYKSYKTESQLGVWIALAILTSIVSIVIFCVRCCDSVTYLQFQYIQTYRDLEQQQFDNAIQTHAKNLAETNVKRFVEQEQVTKEQWDLVSKTPEKVLKQQYGKDISYLTSLNEWTSG